jgi:hypothetical protein
MNSPWKMNLKPIPREQIEKAANQKIRTILGLRCTQHNQTPILKTEGGQPRFETCCDGLDNQVRQAMQ